jgi:hypothetical protein
MNTSSQTEAGLIQPVQQSLAGGETSVRMNPETSLVVDAKNRLVDTRTQQLYKGPITGKHYLVYVQEQPGQPISVAYIENEFGVDRRVNPKPKYQRPTGQHSSKIQKGILLDFLCGERVGTLVLYQRENHFQQELVDGGQRIDIVRKFIKGKLTLTGQQAAKFWAYYLPDIIRGHEQKYDTELQIDSNKILKAIGSNKTMPAVKFENLPYNLKNTIRQLTFDSKLINSIVFKCIEDGSTLTYESPDFDKQQVIDMVRAKFTKLNLQQKPVQPIHQIWGSSDDYNIKSRSFVETTPSIMGAFGYHLNNDDSDSDQEITRTFNDLIVRSMLGFDDKIKWGLGIAKVAENLLETNYDDNIPQDPNSFGFVEFLTKRLDKAFEGDFYDRTNKLRKVELAREMVGVGQKAVMQRLYILSLMEFWKFLRETKKSQKYLNGEIPTERLYHFVELLSKVISTVSMRTIEKELFSNDEKPLKKYGLYTLYQTNQKLFDNLMKLGGHSQKDDYLLKPTLRSVVELIDDYVI